MVSVGQRVLHVFRLAPYTERWERLPLPGEASLSDFRVDLNLFRGPLDLLHYLVRKHEVDICDIPIAQITDQFLEHLAVLEQIDVNAVGDFVAMAATLVELKSQMVLPRPEEEVPEVEDPRHELVERLLEYKKFRDAAIVLDERSRAWQQHYPRLTDDWPVTRPDPADEPIREVELWDLVSAFGRIIRESTAVKPSNIVYDDTPIQAHMARIHALLCQQGEVQFSSLFEPGMHKSRLIGIFLAVLELVRHHRVRVEQSESFGDIMLKLDAEHRRPLDFSGVDNYDHASGQAE